MTVLRRNFSIRTPQSRFTRAGSAHAGLAFGLAITFVLSLIAAGPVAAEEEKGVYLLGAAKEAGQVGEKLDGYVGLIDEKAPDNIKKMVKDTNERRMAKYESIAQKRGTSVESVAKQAGAKIAKRAKPGEMVQNAEGAWSKK